MRASAAIAHAKHQPFLLEPIDIGEPRELEVLVRVAGAGLCHTDIAFRDEVEFLTFPAVLGHEGSGIVEAVGKSVTKVRPGDPVVMSFASCGECAACEAKRPAYCEAFPSLNFLGHREDGSTAITSSLGPTASHFFGQSSFATYALCHERNVVPVPSDLPLELLGPLGCGIQTGAGAVMNSMACPPGSSLLVLGGGAVGLSAVMAAVIQRLDPIIVVEPFEARRNLALELGATHAFAPSVDLPEVVRSVVSAGADYALDTTGRADVLQLGLRCLRRKGTFGFVAAADQEMPPPGSLAELIGAGHTLRGIIEGDSDPDIFIPELIRLFRAGCFPFNKLITTYAFEHINTAVDAHARGDCVKAVLLMSSATATEL